LVPKISYPQLVASVLKLVNQLVEFGYISNVSTITRLVEPLTDLLNGLDDLELDKNEMRHQSVVASKAEVLATSCLHSFIRASMHQCIHQISLTKQTW
jgi:hypothetical protein